VRSANYRMNSISDHLSHCSAERGHYLVVILSENPLTKYYRNTHCYWLLL